MFRAIRHLVESDCCFCLDTVEAIVSTQVDHPDPLEAILLHVDVSNKEEEVKSYVQWMVAFALDVDWSA